MKKELPIITIINSEDGSEIICIKKGYVLTALRGVLLEVLQKADAKTYLQDLINEIEDRP